MDDGEDVNASQLSEIQYPVWMLKDLPHILIWRLRRPQPEVGEVRKCLYPAHDALDHAIRVEGRGAADVQTNPGKVLNCHVRPVD